MSIKVAVTGGTGFIGSYVINLLIEKGYNVLSVGRNCPSQHPNLTFIQHDLIKDYDYSWLNKYKPTHLLHLAWYAEHGKYWTSPLNLKWCDATVRLIEAFCTHGGQRIVVAGSCAEYDWSFGSCKEKITPSNPSTLYGIAKDSARRMGTEISRMADVSLAWGRVFFPFGMGENSNRLIPSVIQVFLGQKVPFSIGTSQWRDILPVEVVADAFVFLLTQQESGIFNICSGKPTQISDIIKQLGFITNQDPNILLSKAIEQSNSPIFLAGDNTTISDLGWQPQYNIEDSLNLYVKILQNNNFKNN
jgi:nucleoside-diphosphate-sugar epimerase